MNMQIISYAEARKQGLPRYFTGRPCKRGHIAPRYTSGTCTECHIITTRIWAAEDYAKNPEKAKARSKRWSKTHPQKHAASSAKCRLAKLEKYREKERKWAANNPEIIKTIDRNKRAKRRSALGSHTAADAKRIRLAQKNRCAYCRVLLGEAGHLDHIVPLSKRGSNSPNNLQWLCEACNMHKHATDPMDYARKIGLLL